MYVVIPWLAFWSHTYESREPPEAMNRFKNKPEFLINSCLNFVEGIQASLCKVPSWLLTFYKTKTQTHL